MAALWHVTTLKKLERYKQAGGIHPPVRAWKTEAAASRFSRQTGRRVVLRLVADASFVPLEGHRGEAVVSDKLYKLGGF